MRKLALLLTCALMGVAAFVAPAPGAAPVHAAGNPWPWTTSTATETAAYMDVVYGNGLWVAVAATGTNRVMITTDPTCTPTAPATSCWTPVDVGTDVGWYSVTYGEGIFVAVGQGATTTEKLAMTSPDGINWIRRATPPTRSTISAWWTTVEYGGGTFVATATRQSSTVNYAVMTSPDGITWTERSTPAFTGCDTATGSYGLCNQWSGLAFGNGRWIAVSTDESNTNKQIMTSTDDGATWTYVTGHTSRSWQDILFVDNTFVALSRGSVNTHALVSTDNGATWSLRWTRVGGAFRLATDGSTVMNVVTNGAGIQSDYVALSTLKTSCLSSNCWTENSSVFFPVPNWTDITYGAGIFLMVGQSGSTRVAYTTTPYAPSRELEVVTIDPNDGVSDPSYQSGSATAALVLATPTRDGYTFSGWNTKKDGTGTPYANGDDYAFSTSATEATTLFAQWTAVSTTTTTTTTVPGTPTTTTVPGTPTTTVAPGTTNPGTSGGSGEADVESAESNGGTLPRTGTGPWMMINLTVPVFVLGTALAARRRLLARG